MIALSVNDREYQLEVHPEKPLLWVLRDELGLKGSKYGCGVGICGVCTVLVDGEPQRSCVVPVSAVEGRSVTTIEGLAAHEDHPVLRAWIDEQVPQCGYCQPGHLIAAAALLKRHPDPTDAEINAALSG
ncbi:MAG: (2Fe-2S)-binding protein, partial [Gammaproteobacteria bacterium]|nr:(2Fe-2S)-binding protein [Gammaproteobacteria bacterium]NIX88535.1 2Fe-2S iron-sulfur cluster binding domain-containing protein [Gammaproteobacteria bacterium]